ncbi:hypothetical protein BDP55DRAFT_360234 [Colletotrichum godetiae]|uniref:Uncharacterized protein n=1 Tax=Colletotrichum godetiae TaxID=1209918 RepID=A0AAJ0ABD9_9PEZI|nr:uncharacterized protein BDP55DRAFT_360234 [Colletotrichum godetiae]KAK1659393.1 hypothetical protein BDP55DRAFT_360234 [Colletotrichum godetiae]
MTLGCGSMHWKRTCGIAITSLIVNSTVGTDADCRLQIQIQKFHVSRTRQPFCDIFLVDCIKLLTVQLKQRGYVEEKHLEPDRPGVYRPLTIHRVHVNAGRASQPPRISTT